MKSNPALMPSLNCAHGKEETRVFHIRSLTSASTLVEVSPRPHDAISKADHCVAEQHPELLVALPPLLGLEDPLKPAPPSFSPFCTSQVCSARCEALEHILAHLPAGPPSYLCYASGRARDPNGTSNAHGADEPSPRSGNPRPGSTGAIAPQSLDRGSLHAHAELAPGPWFSTWTWFSTWIWVLDDWHSVHVHAELAPGPWFSTWTWLSTWTWVLDDWHSEVHLAHANLLVFCIVPGSLGSQRSRSSCSR